MRRLGIIVLALVGFCLEPIPDALGQEEIQVLSIDNYEDGDQPAYSPMASITIKVREQGQGSLVGLVEHNSKGDFYREAHFKYYANPGYSIWRVRLPVKEQEPLRFYAKLESGEATYIDDNDGQGYLYFPRQGMAFYHDRVILNKSSLGVRHYSPDGVYHNQANFAVAVKNLAYAKKVEVIYFVNGDPADHTLKLHYRGRVDYRDATQESGIEPNEQVELWAGQLGLEDQVAEVFYYLRYEVNGRTYVDTNFGRYYTLGLDL